jgi:rRNA-processing protein FCF1
MVGQVAPRGVGQVVGIKVDKRTLVLDTNFLLIPFQFKLEIFSQLERLVEPPYEILVPSTVVSELKKLGRNLGVQGAAARFGLKLVENGVETNKITLIKGKSPVDDWLVDFAKRRKAEGASIVICTNDKGLRARLLGSRISAIVLKSRSKLGFA